METAKLLTRSGDTTFSESGRTESRGARWAALLLPWQAGADLCADPHPPSLPDSGTLRHQCRLGRSQTPAHGRSVERHQGLEVGPSERRGVEDGDTIDELGSVLDDAGLKARPKFRWDLGHGGTLSRQIRSHRRE